LINSQKVVVIDKDYLSTTEEGEQYASAGLRRGVVYITRAKFQEWRQQGILEQKIKHEQDEVAYLRKKALEMFPGLSETTAYELSSNFLKNPNNAKEAKALISEAHNYAEAQGVTSPQGSAIGGTTSSPLEDNKLTRLPLNSEGVNAPGGIDFRSLPIVTQAINNLNTKISPSALGYLKGVNLTQELSQIQNLINSGTIPSAERIKEYIQSSCIQGNNREDIEGLLSCICDILREQEGYCQPTDQLLKDILVVLEATDSNSELEQIFLGKI
jgi:hypothetical protein